jgi:hypothetical protein
MRSAVLAITTAASSHAPGCVDALVAIAGIGIAVLGLAMVVDYRSLGSRIVGDFIPRWLRLGPVDVHRKLVGYGYMVFGVLLLVVCLSAV